MVSFVRMVIVDQTRVSKQQAIPIGFDTSWVSEISVVGYVSNIRADI